MMSPLLFFGLSTLISTSNAYCCDAIVPSEAYPISLALRDNSLLNIQCPGRSRDSSSSMRPCFQDEMDCNLVNGVSVCRPKDDDECSPDFQTRDFWNEYDEDYKAACFYDLDTGLNDACIVDIGAQESFDGKSPGKIHKFKVYKVGHFYNVGNNDDLNRWFIYTAGKENWGDIEWPNGYKMNMDCIGRGGNGCKGDGGWSCPAKNWNVYGRDFLRHDMCNYFWRDCKDGSCGPLNEHCGYEYSEGAKECLGGKASKGLGEDKCF